MHHNEHISELHIILFGDWDSRTPVQWGGNDAPRHTLAMPPRHMETPWLRLYRGSETSADKQDR